MHLAKPLFYISVTECFFKLLRISRNFPLEAAYVVFEELFMNGAGVNLSFVAVYLRESVSAWNEPTALVSKHKALTTL